MFLITKKMKKIYCVICVKMSSLLEETLVLSIICCNCKNEG